MPYIERIVDSNTGEITERPFTAAETKAIETAAKAAQEEATAQAAKAAQREAVLAALAAAAGLEIDEVKAVLG